MAKFFYACSECSRVIEEGEDFCPDHPRAQVLTVVDSSVLTGRKGGSAKTTAKARASAKNGKKGGRPNSWPAEDGGKWLRVKIETGSLAGSLAWQLTDADGNLCGLYDDDGDSLNQGNAQWRATRSKSGPGWIG